MRFCSAPSALQNDPELQAQLLGSPKGDERQNETACSNKKHRACLDVVIRSSQPHPPVGQSVIFADGEMVSSTKRFVLTICSTTYFALVLSLCLAESILKKKSLAEKHIGVSVLFLYILAGCSRCYRNTSFCYLLTGVLA